MTLFRPPPPVIEHRWKPPTTGLLHPNVGVDAKDADLRMTPVPPPILPGPLPTRKEKVYALKNAKLAVNLKWKGDVPTVPNSWNFFDTMPLTGLCQKLRRKKKARRRDNRNPRQPKLPKPPLELNSSPRRNFIQLIEEVEDDTGVIKPPATLKPGKSLGDEPGRGKHLLLLASTAADQLKQAEEKELSYNMLRRLYEAENNPKRVSKARIRSAVHRLSSPISVAPAIKKPWNTSVLYSPPRQARLQSRSKK
eukprot:TRINITY_DN15325_c0_g1_i1.p1 TRINITY_DN15325_c0_g1~~TRINITY_DN15325_c0_g1_i1.p1  ORF type:complete len:280 (+),score=41.12 TRINITY_DN15325_c0_g1_i1:88-840(+)